MIFFVQIPITDVRLFISGESGRLLLPFWPVPEADKEFIRDFGIVRRRSKRGISGWVGENTICDASNIIKLPPKLNNKFKNPHPDFEEDYFYINCVGKHFYFDGICAGKVEFVFATNPLPLSINEEIYKQCMSYILNLNITIGSKNKKVVKLMNSGKTLAAQYLQSTTLNSYLNNVNENWIIPGEIITISTTEFPESFNISDGNSLVFAENIYNTEINHQWYPINLHKINSWHINCKNYSTQTIQYSRNLRLLLMRIHAEQAALRNVCKAFCRGTINFSTMEKNLNSREFNTFQEYLNLSTRKLNRSSNSFDSKYSNSAEYQIIKDSYEKVSPGEYDSLLLLLETINVRPQIYNKMGDYLEKIGHIGNISMNTYHVNQVGVIGDNANLQNVTFNQVLNHLEKNVDLEKLAMELSQLKEKMEKTASTDEEKLSASAIAIAEKAAKEKDGAKVINNLKIAGKWALDVAKGIGIPIAIELLKASIGII